MMRRKGAGLPLTESLPEVEVFGMERGKVLVFKGCRRTQQGSWWGLRQSLPPV
jgi:hypothetical protein